jgi:hypothetical protein
VNVLEMIKRVLGFQDWKEASALPGWRPRPTRMKHSRTPFSSGRKRDVGVQHMTIERFADKIERDLRFKELRERGTPNVSKYSTVEEFFVDEKWQYKSVWCVVRP